MPNQTPQKTVEKANPTTKKKYRAANFWVRLFARGCDILFVSAISFAFSFLFFINSSFTVNDFFSK